MSFKAKIHSTTARKQRKYTMNLFVSFFCYFREYQWYLLFQNFIRNAIRIKWYIVISSCYYCHVTYINEIQK